MGINFIFLPALAGGSNQQTKAPYLVLRKSTLTDCKLSKSFSLSRSVSMSTK